MKDQKTLGILLKQTPLANDDCILEFFTAKYGKVTLFSKKFLRSQKKRKEIDFFRLIEIGIFEGRNSKSLKTAETKALFSNFSADFSSMKSGFSFLETLNHMLPEEKDATQLFTSILKIFEAYNLENKLALESFFLVQTLLYSGTFPHLEHAPADTTLYLDPERITLSKTQSSPLQLELTPINIKIINFLRTTNLETLLQKQEKIPKKNLEIVLEIIKKIKH